MEEYEALLLKVKSANITRVFVRKTGEALEIREF